MSIHACMWEKLYFSGWKPPDNRHPYSPSCPQLLSSPSPQLLSVSDGPLGRAIARINPLSSSGIHSPIACHHSTRRPQGPCSFHDILHNRACTAKTSKGSSTHSAFSPIIPPRMESVTQSYVSAVSALLTYLKWAARVRLIFLGLREHC